MTILENAAPAVESVRGHQKTAALALAHLLDHDLPAAEWHASAITPGELRGQLNPNDTAALEAWAQFLGALPAGTPSRHEPVVYVHVVGPYRGAVLDVWAAIDVSGDVPASAKAEVSA